MIYYTSESIYGHKKKGTFETMKNLGKSLLCLIVYFILQFAVQMIFMMIGALSGIQDQNGLIDFSMNHLLLITLVSNVVTLGLFAIVNKIRKKSAKEAWSMTPVGAKWYIYPALAAFLLSFAWALATYDLSFANAEQIENSVSFYSNLLPGLGGAMMAFTLLFAQPVMEEVLCRGIMLNLLKDSFPDWAAVLMSAVIFGFAHLMAGGEVLAFGAALMGACFGLVFVRTGSLYPAIVAHAFANLPDFVMALLPEMQSGVRIALAVAAAVVSVVILLLIYKKGEENKVRQ